MKEMIDSQSAPVSYFDKFCTSVGCGVECGKGMLCDLTNNVTQSVSNLVNKIYGTTKETTKGLSAKATDKGSDILSSAAADLKEASDSISSKDKGLFGLKSGKSKPNLLNANSKDDKCCKSVIKGAKIAVAAVIIACVAHGAYRFYQKKKIAAKK